MSTDLTQAASPPATRLMRLDSRGRINLRPLAPASDSYQVTVDDDGVIVMTPLVSITVKAARELEQLRAREITTPPQEAPTGDA